MLALGVRITVAFPCAFELPMRFRSERCLSSPLLALEIRIPLCVSVNGFCISSLIRWRSKFDFPLRLRSELYTQVRPLLLALTVRIPCVFT